MIKHEQVGTCRVVILNFAAEVRKHLANDPKCSKLGWVSIPCQTKTLVDCSYRLGFAALHLNGQTGCSSGNGALSFCTPAIITFNCQVIGANARALLSRSGFISLCGLRVEFYFAYYMFMCCIVIIIIMKTSIKTCIYSHSVCS